MPKAVKKTQAREPFSEVAQRLGDALADVLIHPNCPTEVANIIGELNAEIFNRFPDTEVSLRHDFPRRLVGAFEQPA